MGNLTIAIDEESLKKARIRALHEGTSVNALLREFLDSYAGVRREQKRPPRRIASLFPQFQVPAGRTDMDPR